MDNTLINQQKIPRLIDLNQQKLSLDNFQRKKYNKMKEDRKQSRQRQISICVQRILNWPQPQHTQSTFQLSFYANPNNSLITSNIIIGKYQGKTHQMLLNTMLRISYQTQQETVILRLSQKIGLGGMAVLGQFELRLGELVKMKQMRFPIDEGKGQYLIVLSHDEHRRSNNLINIINSQHHVVNQLLLYEQKHGIQQQKKSSSKTKQFIKQRLEFLENHSKGSKSRTKDETRGVKGRGKIDYYGSSNCYYDIDMNEKNLLSTHSSSCDYNKIMSARKNRDTSSNNSSRTNSSSQRYVLNVNNLNVVPIDEYYATNRMKNQGKDSRLSNVPSCIGGYLQQNPTISPRYINNQPQNKGSITKTKLKQQFIKHSQYYN